MKRSVQLAPVVDLSPFLGGRELVALDVGPDGRLYLLAGARWDYHGRGGAPDRNGGVYSAEGHLLRELGREERIEEVARLTLRDEEGAPLKAEVVIGRGSALYLLRGARLYRCEVQEMAAA
jgi:hypothetical protein